jgi:hypothetical protein
MLTAEKLGILEWEGRGRTDRSGDRAQGLQVPLRLEYGGRRTWGTSGSWGAGLVHGGAAFEPGELAL